MKTILNLTSRTDVDKTLVMSKTAVQELIEWLESDSEVMMPAFHEKWDQKKKEMLELEKEQIIKAYNYGWRVAIALQKHTPEDPNEYYNINYEEHGTGQRISGDDTGTRTSTVF